MGRKRSLATEMLFAKVEPELKAKLDAYVEALRESGWRKATISDVMVKALYAELGRVDLAEMQRYAVRRWQENQEGGL